MFIESSKRLVTCAGQLHGLFSIFKFSRIGKFVLNCCFGTFSVESSGITVVNLISATT